MAAWESLALAAYTAAALLLVALAGRAWRKTGSPKVLLIAGAFAVFLAKGLLFSYGLFTSVAWRNEFAAPGLVLDACALGLLYAAVLRRG
ncbi:MAG: hypothetical protein WC876_11150 [Candidatus Thermoplasmatota archaeon]|jgi:hypothetical protein